MPTFLVGCNSLSPVAKLPVLQRTGSPVQSSTLLSVVASSDWRDCADGLKVGLFRISSLRLSFNQ